MRAMGTSFRATLALSLFLVFLPNDATAAVCTMAEVMGVGTAADATSAVMALMGTNAPCGQCIMKCASAPDSTSCAMACASGGGGTAPVPTPPPPTRPPTAAP